MMGSAFHYLHLDVFTDRRFGGNQLAVFPSGVGLDAGTMQAIAQEMAFSETTFVFPREDAATDVRVRIFTPGKELPMAGHPTIGTAFALARTGAIPADQPAVVFGLGVGPTRVDLTWAGRDLAFAWMTQLPPTFGLAVDDIAEMAGAIGLEADDIHGTGLPIEQVSCGVPFLFVPLATRSAVDRSICDVARLTRFFARLGVPRDLGVFLFSPERGADDATVYSRMFAPGLGVAEDPATGSASGPLGCYLVRHKVVPATAAGSILSLQGVKMGRPSRIHIEIGVDGDAITRVRVGGEAVYVAEGTMEVGGSR
jgi:trans-2,3-dihydro-3-hydroxyanthranilate isomerase